MGWVNNDAKLKLTKQCKIRFAISVDFIDEVELDVVPLNVWGVYLEVPTCTFELQYSSRNPTSIGSLKIENCSPLMRTKASRKFF